MSSRFLTLDFSFDEKGVCNICGKPLKRMARERRTEEDRERQEGRRNRGEKPEGGKEYGDSKERRED